MTAKLIAAALSCVICATTARAGPVAIDVHAADGSPLSGAVVTLEMPGVATPAPRGTYSVEQRNIAFEPHILIVPVGATVGFPNRDKVRHHVYSFSKPKKFDLKLYGREDTRTVTFDRPGVVALGCNIHDSMSGFVRVWHPSIRAPGNVLSQAVTVTPSGLTSHLTLRR